MSFLRRLYDGRWGYFFIFPAYLFFTFFILVPFFKGLLYSFYKISFAKENVWVGFNNYKQLFADSVFWTAYFNTLKFVFIGVPLIVILSLIIAVLIYPMNNHFQTFVKVSFYLPVVAGGVVLSIAWKYIVNPTYGFLNYLGSLIGLEPINWMGTANMAFFMLIIILISFNLGQPIILFLAGLGSISPELYDAAKVDGASPLRRFLNITIPQLKPTTFFVAITQMIGVFQVFVIILMMTNGGPANGTVTTVYRMYDMAFSQQNFGYASTIGVFIIFSTSIFTFIFFRVFKDSSQFYR